MNLTKQEYKKYTMCIIKVYMEEIDEIVLSAEQIMYSNSTTKIKELFELSEEAEYIVERVEKLVLCQNPLNKYYLDNIENWNVPYKRNN